MTDFTGTRILAIFAHPDDEAFTVGGTLAALTDRGATVTLVCATRGEEGEIAHPSLATPETLGHVRELELRNAAALLGIDDVRFLGFRDSGMFGTDANTKRDAFVQQPVADVARTIASVIQDVRPDAIITFSEDGGYLHPDHVHVHESVAAAAEIVPDLVPHLYFSSFPREFFVALADLDHDPFAGTPPERRARMGQPLAAFTTIVDVDPYVDRKIAAFAAHKTQQPAEGDRPFIEDESMRREFARREHFIRAAGTGTVPDPLVRISAELNAIESD